MTRTEIEVVMGKYLKQGKSHYTQQVGGRPFKIERTSLFQDSQRFSAFTFYIDRLRWRPWT